MKYTVVQWVGEERAVSVVAEKDITSPAEEIVEGKEVVILRGDNNKAKIFQAIVLKVFETRAKAKDYEQKLIKPTKEDAEDPSKTKRSRKPSRKAMESTDEDLEPRDTSDGQNSDLPPKDKAGKRKRKDGNVDLRSKVNLTKGNGKNNDQNSNAGTNNTKLQETVQGDRVSAILTCRNSEGKRNVHAGKTVVVSDDDDDSTKHLLSPAMPDATTVTPPAASTLPDAITVTPPVAQVRPPLGSLTAPGATAITPPAVQTRLPMGSPAVPDATAMTPPAAQFRLPLGSPAVPDATAMTPPAARVRLPLGSPAAPDATAMTPPAVVEPWLSSAWSTQASLSLPQVPYQHQSQSAAPQAHRHEHSFTELLNSPKYNIDLLTTQPQQHPQRQEWDSFSKHSTMAFESLKADVEYLKNEVKYLRGNVKERKATQAATLTEQSGSSCLGSDEPDEQQCLNELVKNVQPPREALKILLYHLYTVDELRTQSLKGVATKGASGNGLDKKKMAQLNTAMRNTFPTVTQGQIDDWIRGQQKKQKAKTE